MSEYASSDVWTMYEEVEAAAVKNIYNIEPIDNFE